MKGAQSERQMYNRKRQPEVGMDRKWGIVEMKVGNIYIK